ncbi:MAG: hypothetical protein HKN94_05500 [Acidimicrobiales bacterium]|nr:hypothetical protein [Acidimicrobiales bacterium]RZV48358.1 MAG: hypothetical protein EX269_02105 [Acidimicrobiales bacterium]
MIATIAISLFITTGACAGFRLLRGPTLADRVAALDVALISLMGGIAVNAADTGSVVYLDLLAVIAIVGFTATVAASRFIEHEGIS